MEITKLRVTLRTVLTAALFAVTLAASSLTAQTNAAPATDPFLKKNAPAAAPVPAGPITNTALTFEFYLVGQADGAALLQGNDSDQARYDGMVALVKQGKARLEALISGVQQPGQQSTLEQIDVFPYAIAFQANWESGALKIRPVDFKVRNLGYRVVFKSGAGVDPHGCYVNLFPEHTRLAGFLDQPARLNNYDCTIPQPTFNVQRVNIGALYFPYGQIRFVNSFNPPPPVPAPAKKGQAASQPEEPQMGLIFARAQKIQYDPGAASDDVFAPLDLEVSIYSMDRALALQVLGEAPHGDSTFRAVQQLVKSGQAKLEHLALIRTPPGIKSNIDETAEKIHTTGGDADQWTTQDVGFTAEIEADLIGHNSLVSLNVTQCQFLNDLGPVQADGLAGQLTATQPMFELQSAVSKLNSALGVHTLLGTMNHPGDTGIPGHADDGRVWLAFIQASAVKP